MAFFRGCVLRPSSTVNHWPHRGARCCRIAAVPPHPTANPREASPEAAAAAFKSPQWWEENAVRGRCRRGWAARRRSPNVPSPQALCTPPARPRYHRCANIAAKSALKFAPMSPSCLVRAALPASLQGLLQCSCAGHILLHVEGPSHEHAEGLHTPAEP